MLCSNLGPFASCSLASVNRRATVAKLEVFRNPVGGFSKGCVVRRLPKLPKRRKEPELLGRAESGVSGMCGGIESRF